MFGIIFIAVVCWRQIGKEEMPEFAMEWIRVSVRYHGATAHDVELFITKPIEEKIKGISGIYEVSSNSSYGSSSLRFSFEPGTRHLQEKIQEVKDAVNSIVLPKEADHPVFHQFRSSEKAIIDIGMYLKGIEILDTPSRIRLQKYALAFRNKILSQPEVSGISASGYLRPELQITTDPDKLNRSELSMNQIRQQIIRKNIRRSVGSLTDQDESDVTILSELEDPKVLEDVIISSGFSGHNVRLRELADIHYGFEKNNQVIKIQGHEGIVFNIQKSSSTDILSAQEAVLKFTKSFRESNSDSGLEFVIMDDESYDVRNRLSLIGKNGLIGFLLILIVLFIFLDLRSGLWVAMGIPFSLAVTLIIAMTVGYTVNNMTLSAVIIVLGVVVDDAIIVAENIARRKRSEDPDAASEAIKEVMAPIIASVLTTCAAFIPLLFFNGRFGLFVRYIPLLIFIMLFASLLESFFILPAHLSHSFNISQSFSRFYLFKKISSIRDTFVLETENFYASILYKILHFRSFIILIFTAILILSGYVFLHKMKYVMFPREESRDFRLQVLAKEGTKKYEMARKIRSVENILLKSPYVTSVSSSIGVSRHGGQVREHEASMRVEITPPSERDVSLQTLIREWTSFFEKVEGFDRISIRKGWFGSTSGSPVVIEVQENDDDARAKITERLKQKLEAMTSLKQVEIERPLLKSEYALNIRREKASRLGVNFDDIASVLRAYVEGDILYTINSGEEEIDVRLGNMTENKSSIGHLLNMKVANKNDYLIPIRDLVDVVSEKKAANISRINYKRTTTVYADMADQSEMTPLDVAERIEKNIFPLIVSDIPSANLVFRGEVEDSRKSRNDFAMSVMMVMVIIFILLVFLFDSLWKPLLIGAIIPFGLVGSILAFWGHGINQYGFFAVVGCLGMIGVVINDSIVLIDRYNSLEQLRKHDKKILFRELSALSSTRLRAVIITTLTTVLGLFPTAYGLGGYDSMLAEMMFAMGWGLISGMLITLILVPCLYSYYIQIRLRLSEK